MLGLIKLLYSLSEAIPILRSLLIDLVSMLKEANVNRRKKFKDSVVCSRIDSLLIRMHHAETRERKPSDEQE